MLSVLISTFLKARKHLISLCCSHNPSLMDEKCDENRQILADRAEQARLNF
jgi:hypothetical protein